jgi:hypothetical protein
MTLDEVEVRVSPQELLERNFGSRVVHQVAEQSVLDENIDLRGRIRRLEFMHQAPFKKYIHKITKDC